MHSRFKLKFKGAINAYLQWPVILSVLLILMWITVAFVSGEAAGVITPFILVYILIVAFLFYVKRKYLLSDIVRFAAAYGTTQNEQMRQLSVPYGIIDAKMRLLWSNDELKDIIVREEAARSSIKEIFKDFNLSKLPTVEEDAALDIVYNEKNYHVEVRALDFGETESDLVIDTTDANGEKCPSLYAVYFHDETQMRELRKNYDDERIVVALLYIDNYEETLEIKDEVQRSVLTAIIDKRINAFLQPIDAIAKRIEKDKYLILFEHQYLQPLIDTKFVILNEVRDLSMDKQKAITLSIGISVGANSYSEGFAQARSAIDLALGRGGDQVVVKEGTEIRYFGARSSQASKNTKVKARMQAQVLKELFLEKDKVIIMGHTLPDIDCFGAGVGIARMARSLGKTAHIVLNEATSSIKPMMDLYLNDPTYDDMLFVNSDMAKDLMTPHTVLVIVDVNKPSYMECPDLIPVADAVVVIDHHRQTGEQVENAIISYIDPNASSACEMIAELIQYFDAGVKVRPVEADAMYAGILIDSDNFKTKVGSRTFEATAFLKRIGADLTRIRKMFRTDREDYFIKASAIANAENFMDYYMFTKCIADEEASPTVLASQVANELMNIQDVKGAFVFTEYGGKIHVSARSIDELNVQVIMEKVGGGGHMSMAGAQFADITVEEAMDRVKEALKDYIEKGN